MHKIAINTATSHPSPMGVSGTPGMTGMNVGTSLVLDVALSDKTPPFTEEATVLMLPLATCIGAVEEALRSTLKRIVLVEENSNEIGSASPPLVVQERKLLDEV